MITFSVCNYSAGKRGFLAGARYIHIAPDLIEFNHYFAAFAAEGDIQLLSSLLWGEKNTRSDEDRDINGLSGEEAAEFSQKSAAQVQVAQARPVSHPVSVPRPSPA